MNEYYVLKITMDTYRYRLFKMLFESYGIREETKKDPYADAAHKEDRIRVWDYSTGDRKAVCGRED